jgi:L-lactate dehydrogenase complex protein LldE
MKLALFVPCLVNHLYPRIARDSLELLERLGHRVIYPPGQTCCGQVMSNSGCLDEARASVLALGRAFGGHSWDAVVAPTASCVLSAKENLLRLSDDPELHQVAEQMHELTGFLHDVAPIDGPLRPIRRRVSLQMSCSGLRKLGVGTASETVIAQPVNKLRDLLETIPGLDIREPTRDECCGFGGTFSVDERDISGKMARDKVADHVATGADAIVGYEPSCLMSLEGVVRRGGLSIEVMHFSSLLNEAIPR